MGRHAAPRGSAFTATPARTASVHKERLEDELIGLVEGTQRHLPPEAIETLGRIRSVTPDLLGMMNRGNQALDEQAHAIEQTIRSYLRGAVANYMRLAPLPT